MNYYLVRYNRRFYTKDLITYTPVRVLDAPTLDAERAAAANVELAAAETRDFPTGRPPADTYGMYRYLPEAAVHATGIRPSK